MCYLWMEGAGECTQLEERRLEISKVSLCRSLLLLQECMLNERGQNGALENYWATSSS